MRANNSSIFFQIKVLFLGKTLAKRLKILYLCNWKEKGFEKHSPKTRRRKRFKEKELLTIKNFFHETKLF